MGDDARVYAGVDTHKDKHVLCVLDQMGRKVLTEEFSADADGYERLAAATRWRCPARDAAAAATTCATAATCATSSTGAARSG